MVRFYALLFLPRQQRIVGHWLQPGLLQLGAQLADRVFQFNHAYLASGYQIHELLQFGGALLGFLLRSRAGDHVSHLGGDRLQRNAGAIGHLVQCMGGDVEAGNHLVLVLHRNDGNGMQTFAAAHPI